MARRDIKGQTMTDDMTAEMAQAIRDVVNFSRFDEKYQALSRFERQHEARSEYFEKNLTDIADNNGVGVEELRDWMKRLLKAESFGLEVRNYGGQERVVKM
jgi:hypothetical protein